MVLENEDSAKEKLSTDFNYKFQVDYYKAAHIIVLHIFGAYGAYRLLYCKHLTILWGVFLSYLTAIGITMGAHRLFTHRSFKATFIVRLFLVIFQTMSHQEAIYTWAKTHRLHHKYSDTDADPHNATRGFFFSHVGWLMLNNHPLVDTKLQSTDVKDLEADALVMNQKKYYYLWVLVFHALIPAGIPIYLWNESCLNAITVCIFFRFIVNFHATMLVNSAAHMYGNKPFDKDINPVENGLISAITVGEGWHNYHHAFPYDYKAAEYGANFQFTTHVIDLLAKYNFVYDLKSASDETIRKKVLSKGDGSYHMKIQKTRT